MGVTVAPQVYVRRGDLAARADEAALHVTSRMKVSLFWLGRTPLTTDREFLFRLGTARVPGRIETIRNLPRQVDSAKVDCPTDWRWPRNETAQT